MEMNNSVFAVKLYEMGEQYGKLQCRIRVCEENNRKRIHETELMKGPVMEALHSQESSPEQDEEEADMLYAEFAMDFATLAVQQAMLSVLSALDRKNDIEKSKGVKNQEEDI